MREEIYKRKDGMAEEDDPVEHEINVFLSKSLAENLYLLQYPVRPAHMTYDHITHLSARVKPSQRKVEIELHVNTSSVNYAHSKGEQIALNVDGPAASRGADVTYTSGLMDRQVLTSAPSTSRTGRYAVGLLKEGELHLTPLNAAVQMRPSFSYLDTVDTRVKTEQAAADAAGDSSQEEAEEDAKPITVKFSRPESDEAKARRMASYEFHRRKYDGESWVPVEYHGLQDDMAVSERMLLQATQGDDLSEFQLFPHDYLARLVPPHIEEREEKPAMPSNILSLSQLRTLPLADQIKALLTNVKVIRFSQLMSLLPQGTDTVSALRSVQQVAVLVQGCWVVKSDILYPKDMCSPHSGVSSEYLCRGRDFMMWKFTQSRHVIRKDISSIVKLPAEDVKDILEQMSKVKASKGWEFLFDYDKEFTDKYCEIVQRQKMLWDAKYQSLSKQFKIPKEAEKKSKAGEQSVGHTDKPRRRRTSSKSSPSKRERTLSGRSLSDHSDIEMEAAKNVAAGPVNITVEPMEVCDSNHVIANGPITELTNSVVVENGGKCSSDLKQALIAFSRDILRERLIFPLHELKRLFALKLQMCSPGHVLGCGVSDKQLEESLIEAGGIRLNNQWPPNSTNEPLFALLRKGDPYDTIRGVLFDLFKSSYQIRKEAFRKQIEEKTGQELPDADCKKLMREYCVVKAGGWWYLKGTVSES